MTEPAPQTSNDQLTKYGLPASILSSLETFAQSVAGVAPSAAPAMTAALTFASAGDGAWLTYLIATGIVFLTVLSINVFATRSSSPGSLYAYATEGGGSKVGFITGWNLFAAYVCATACCSVQCTIFLTALLQNTGFPSIHPGLLVILCNFCVWMIAYRNVKLSAELMLWLEIISVAIIVTLLTSSTVHAGTLFDMAQLSLHGTTFSGIGGGLVMAILAFVGFESAASLGSEASSPLKRIPDALRYSVIFAGLFFVLTTYALVQGFTSVQAKLAGCPTPLYILAQNLGLGWLGTVTNFGAAISFFACCLALINAGARVVMTMSSDGLLPAKLQSVHQQNKTPYISIFVSSLAACLIAATLTMTSAPLVDIVGWLGTIGTYHFIFAYALVCMTVPGYMRSRGEWKPKHTIVSALAALSMVGAFLGTVFPIPAAPYCWLPCVSLTFSAAGLAYFLRTQQTSSQT